MNNVRDIPFGRPWIEDVDRDAVMEVLQGHILTHGPKCAEFERKFEDLMGGGHAVTTSSCMASLHLASIYFGFGEGDEIIVPAQTHVATVHAIELVGAKPVFVDCELETGNIDIDKIEAAITDKTKGISLVHFAGIPVRMDRIMAIAKKHDLRVVEDCALAVGATYKGKHVGLWGDVGCYSFYPVKHITTGEGGMLVSRDEKTAKEIANFRAFSVDRTHTERKVPGVYDVTGVGMNYRMSEMQSALGCTQLDKVPVMLAKRKANFECLKEHLLALPDLHVLDSHDPDVVNSYYCLVLVLQGELAQRRTEMIEALKARKVGTSVYYPQPVPRMSYYQGKYGYENGLYTNAEIISDHSISLPVGPHLDLDDMDYIANCFKDILKKEEAA
ncbi:MAG: cell wall biogenesis protein [Zetaproteobacteria bacterium]|nr:MAG: cell wall biogenesis protein [Zetaproteobacteria bacterium]